MAHHVEPMDVDSDFDNKENSLHHNNVLPFTEKGYEELDVSELNMKLRYSITPASSPMSRSYTANCLDNRSHESGEDTVNVTINENSNLTRSLNSTLTKNDIVKTVKALPLQALSTEQFVDNNRSTSVLRPFDSTFTQGNASITVTVSGTSDIDENLSLRSSSSSTVQTPEATTPTMEILKNDGGSPIMRGLKSVLNMFRSSQSPIPASDNEDVIRPEILSPAEPKLTTDEAKSHEMLASTPISAYQKKETSPTKRSSPHKDSIVFNEDLEKELQWKDETTIIFSQERMPIHKLYFNLPQTENKTTNNDIEIPKQEIQDDMNSTVEYMDISCNDSIRDRTLTDIHIMGNKSECTIAGESDGEFVDCETTLTKNESLIDDKDNTPVNDKTHDFDITKDLENMNENTSGSRLKQIILNTTQDILDATLSITPEDLLPEAVGKTKDIPGKVLLPEKTETTQDILVATLSITPEDMTSEILEKTEDPSQVLLPKVNIPSKIHTGKPNESIDTMVPVVNQESSLTLGENIPVLNETVDIAILSSGEQKKADPNVMTTIENYIQPLLDQTIDIINSLTNVENEEVLNVTNTIEHIQAETDVNIPSEINTKKDNEFIDTVVSVLNQESSLSLEENLPVLNQTVAIASLSLVEHKKEDPNVTTTIENDIKPLLYQTIDKLNSLTNVENKEEPNVSNTIEHVPAETIISENQPVIENLDSTSSTETIVQNDKMFQDLSATLTSYNSDTNMIPDTTADIENKKTALNVSHVTNHNSSNTVAANSSLETVEEAINIPLPITDNVIEPTPVKEASLTELAADIPLPDEDDLEKELDINVDILMEATTGPNSLPFDLVDDIKVESNTHQIKHDVPLTRAEVSLEENGNFEKKVPLEINQAQDLALPNFEGGNNVQNETALLDSEEIKLDQEVIEPKNEKLLFSEEPRIATIDVLPKTAPTLNIVDNEYENKSYQVLDDVEMINTTETVTESLNATVTCNIDESLMQGQQVVPMDINESVIALKTLPDIVNQTITNQSNFENFESTTNISEPIVMEQPAPLTEIMENTLNEIPHPEIAIPELLSDASISKIVKPANELANVTQEIFPNTPATKEIINDPVTNTCDIITTEDAPVLAQTTTFVQPNYGDVTPTEPIMLKNEEQLPDTDNALVSGSADIKVEDEEVILSDIIIAKDIPITEPEDNFQVQNNNDQIATTGGVVNIPPASPPIASKGYNFNFDEIDDPFATKTKIRLSPSLDTPTKAIELIATSKSGEKPMPRMEMNNRRKSQPERKRPVAPKRKFNSTFSGAGSEKIAEKPVENFAAGDINLNLPSNVALDPNNISIDEDKLIQEARIVHEKTLDVTKEVLSSEREIKLKDNLEESVEKSYNKVSDSTFLTHVESDIIISKEIKTTSSSEQSAYYSADTSSSESIHSRNVFNLPEIDDINFNPFATKSKMRQSPPPSLDMENPFSTRSKIRSSPESSMITPQNYDTVKVQDVTKTEDKMETELMEKNALENISNTTILYKATDDRNVTIREVNTEDEDTIEGPFFEAADLDTEDKTSDFFGNNVDMMQSNDLPTQGNEDNLDNGELFIDAEAFEFLLNQNKSNTVVDSGKESLFLKFDPLFAKRMSSITSDGVVAALNKIQKRQSTPIKDAKPLQKEVISPIAGPSNLNRTQNMDMNISEEFNDELNITISKPMMVVPPAVNPVTPRNKSLTPNRSNRRSITFTSPAMAVIDRLLSLSGNSSHLHDTTVTQVTREQNEAELALIQLRELLAEKEVHVFNLKSESKELKDRLISLESHLKNLELESQDRLKNINDLNNRLGEKTKINKNMAAVVEEYERTIASLISETAQDKKRHAEERIKLINERDEQTAHLASMEVSFSDLHSKYEKSKQIILHCKANEDAYKKSIKEFEKNLTKMQNNYELLKQHATSKLNHANQELEKMNKTHEADVLKLNAMIKRKELHITSLEETLTQKTKANEELTAICDELLNKV